MSSSQSSRADIVVPEVLYMQALLPLVGRILLASLFLWEGVKDIRSFEAAAANLPGGGNFFSAVILIGAIVCLMLGSIALYLGIKARWGAVLLIIFLLPGTIAEYSPAGGEDMIPNILTNLALVGALLLVVSFGPGPLSFDGPSPSKK